VLKFAGTTINRLTVNLNPNSRYPRF